MTGALLSVFYRLNMTEILLKGSLNNVICTPFLALLHSERPKLFRVMAGLSAIGLRTLISQVPLLSVLQLPVIY